ncbi:MAG: DUF4390 domain-containing protein [Betaproteobacteria bacterium]|nr:DUF4390 domain-containing protein [Betaproteobacteria bacterium]
MSQPPDCTFLQTPSPTGRGRSALVIAVAFVLCLLFPVVARADGVQLTSVKLDATEDGYQLNADFEILLASSLLETIRKGVPLYFVVEFEMSRGRWYWLDEVSIRATRERRVSYLPLAEQYRLNTAGISQNLSTADDVRRVLSRIRSWTIAERGKFKPGDKFEAAIRFRLDTAQLPKPFQLNTFGSREWNLSSDWHRWTVTIGKDGSVSP